MAWITAVRASAVTTPTSNGTPLSRAEEGRDGWVVDLEGTPVVT
jgi:hypothetical protein